MAQRKNRSEIPPETAAQVMFQSDRTCCVCREANKPVQIHHVDEDPNNHALENLAVLCLDCHHRTQVRGGFDRKLDRHQVLLYRDDWVGMVRNRRGPTSRSNVGVAPQPDVRLRALTFIVPPQVVPTQVALGIKVENHSATPVFLGNVFFELTTKQNLVILQDCITGEPQQRRRLEPGESFTFHASPRVLAAKATVESFVRAGISDDLGRCFWTDRAELQKAVAAVLTNR
jgi:hypothetical protein